MDNSSSHRIQHRLAVVDNEVPDFMSIKNGIYLSSNNGKTGNVLFFEDGVLKYKNSDGVVTEVSNKIAIGEHISIGEGTPSEAIHGSVIIGKNIGESLLTGSHNIFLGSDIAESMTEGVELIAIGKNTLKNSSAFGGSIAIGIGSMGNCGKTDMNIGIGKETLANINDSYNIAIGVEAGKNMFGDLINHNIAFGHKSMENASNSAIDIISVGTQSCSNISGNNFKSIYIGDRVAQRLSSNVISTDNIGIGSESLIDASNISDIICIGSLSGQSVSGVKSILLGAGAGNNSHGSLNDEILIGTNVGSHRKYTDSRNILIGLSAGSTGSGIETVSIGNNSSCGSEGNYNTMLGSKSGEYLTGNDNLCLGNQSGSSLKGSHNVCLGSRTGYGLEGNRNIWIGEGPQVADVLNDSIVIGPGVFIKGNEAVVIGSQVGKSSIGYLNRDILIGANAGMGQRYNDSLVENRGILLIGANAGLGDPDHPENINSADLVCLGHSAGHSNEQNFYKTVMIGNYAGSYSNSSAECVIVGHSAGVGMSGESNIFVGAHAGFNVKGNRNILIGSHCGDQAGEIEAELDEVLAIGHSNRPTLLGNLQKGNIMIGATAINTPEWTDGKGTLGFTATERPATVSSNISGVLYAHGKHLEYATDKRITNLTFPYKFISQGEMSLLRYSLNVDVDGGTLLTFKIVPSTKPHLMLSEEVMLNVLGKTCTITRGCSDRADRADRADTTNRWNIEIVNKELHVSTNEDVKGICYLEAVGVHILKEIK